MKLIFTVTMAALILLAIFFSFSREIGLDELYPGLDRVKNSIVAVAVLIGAGVGLFHKFNKFKNRNSNE